MIAEIIVTLRTPNFPISHAAKGPVKYNDHVKNLKLLISSATQIILILLMFLWGHTTYLYILLLKEDICCDDLRLKKLIYIKHGNSDSMKTSDIQARCYLKAYNYFITPADEVRNFKQFW